MNYLRDKESIDVDSLDRSRGDSKTRSPPLPREVNLKMEINDVYIETIFFIFANRVDTYM